MHACDASKRLELYDVGLVSGYVALRKISFVYNFYNIRTTQKVMFFGKDDVPVETDEYLDDYKKKKNKLIKDTEAALIESLATTKEVVKLYNSITEDERETMKKKGYLYERRDICLDLPLFLTIAESAAILSIIKSIDPVPRNISLNVFIASTRYDFFLSSVPLGKF